jgi:hypothetical protein
LETRSVGKGKMKGTREALTLLGFWSHKKKKKNKKKKKKKKEEEEKKTLKL